MELQRTFCGILSSLTCFMTLCHLVNLQPTTKENNNLIDLKGSIKKVNDNIVYVLVCSSIRRPMGWTAEFIIDGKTQEHVSVHNGQCYNSNNQMCPDTECSCIPSKITMTWITKKQGNIFACQMRFLQDNGDVVKAFASVSFNETGVVSHKQEYDTMSRETENKKSNGTNNSNPSDQGGIPSWIIAIIVAIIILAFTFGIIISFIVKCKNLYRTGEKGPESRPLVTIVKERPAMYKCVSGGFKVRIGKFSLNEQIVYTDVIAVFVPKDLQLKSNDFTKTILQAAGSKLQSELNLKKPNGLNYGEVIPVPSGGLNAAKLLYLGCLPSFEDDINYFEETLEIFLQNCMEQANNDAAESVKFYTPDVLYEQVPADIVAKCYKSSIETYKSKHVSTFTERIFIAVNARTDVESKSLKTFVEVFSATKEEANFDTYLENPKIGECWLEDASQTETKAVVKLVENTWISRFVGKGRDGENLEKLNYTRINVTKVQKVFNYELLSKYKEFKNILHKKLHHTNDSFDHLENITRGQTNRQIMTDIHFDLPILSHEINEYFLFHGAQEDQIAWVTQHGLTITNESKSFCGNAIYAFESSTKSDQYADNKQKRDKSKPKKMILGRFALGEIYVTKHIKQFSRPPCKKCGDGQCRVQSHKHKGFGCYDSIVIDGKWNFREFLVFNENQCYPEYVITYQRQ